jgi:5,10-methenyltetrahydromethanopterin hydrogenase
MKVDVRDATNKKIIMNWTKEKLDVTGYNLGFGPNMNSAVKVQLGNIDNYVISGLNNLDTQDYYVRLQAFDKAGNKGEETVYLCEKSCASVCDCQKL